MVITSSLGESMVDQILSDECVKHERQGHNHLHVILIYIYRERERERDRQTTSKTKSLKKSTATTGQTSFFMRERRLGLWRLIIKHRPISCILISISKCVNQKDAWMMSLRSLIDILINIAALSTQSGHMS